MSLAKITVGKREYQLVQVRALIEPKRARIQVVRLDGTLWEDDVSLPKEQYDALTSCVALQPSLAGTGHLYVAALMRPYDSETKWLFKTIDGGVRFGIPAAWKVNKVSKSEDDISSGAVSSPFLGPSEGAMNYALQSANAGQIIQKLIKWKCSLPTHDKMVTIELSGSNWEALLKSTLSTNSFYPEWLCAACLPDPDKTYSITEFLIKKKGIPSPWKQLAAISTCSVCKDNPTLCTCSPVGCNLGSSSKVNCADILRLFLEEEVL